MNRALRTAPLALVALLSACSSPAPAAAPHPSPTVLPACTKLPAPALPHSAGQLTERQNGVYCLPRGGRVDVFLTAAKRSDLWHPVKASGSVLTPTSTGVMTAPLDVRPAMFVGAEEGTAVLTSSTPSGSTWRATIVVK
ncbi:hypothetical protein [Streptomyces sp. NK08204]|uniref:hypothetical protein n=1 Tax=Streptomyces sp. NK08204 TaxID=2873260 RepID=UPI001CED887A|nr:hypothetical protein [Streptomyces sp. NK08204]